MIHLTIYGQFSGPCLHHPPLPVAAAKVRVEIVWEIVVGKRLWQVSAAWDSSECFNSPAFETLLLTLRLGELLARGEGQCGGGLTRKILKFFFQMF